MLSKSDLKQRVCHAIDSQRDDIISIGDTIQIKGQTSDFTQTIESMQLDGEDVEKAKKGQSVGVKVSTRARRTDSVFKIAD